MSGRPTNTSQALPFLGQHIASSVLLTCQAAQPARNKLCFSRMQRRAPSTPEALSPAFSLHLFGVPGAPCLLRAPNVAMCLRVRCAKHAWCVWQPNTWISAHLSAHLNAPQLILKD